MSSFKGGDMPSNELLRMAREDDKNTESLLGLIKEQSNISIEQDKAKIHLLSAIVEKLDIQIRHSIGQSRLNKFMLFISSVALVVTSYAVIIEVESKGQLSTEIIKVIKSTGKRS